MLTIPTIPHRLCLTGLSMMLWLLALTPAQAQPGSTPLIDSLNQLLVDYPASTPDSVRLKTMLRLAAQYQRTDALQSQRTTLEAVRLARTMHIPHLEALALRYLAEAKRTVGDYPAALQHALEGLHLIRDDPRRRNVRMSLLNTIAILYSYLGQHTEALTYDSLVLALARERNDTHAEMVALTNIGDACLNTNRTDIALTVTRRALDLSRQHHDTNSEMIALSNLGDIYAARQQPEEAIAYFDEAIRTGQRADDPTVPYTQIQLAKLYIRQTGQYNLGLTLAHSIESYALQVDDGELIQDIYNLLADGYERQGQATQAIVYYKKAEDKEDELYSRQRDNYFQSLKLDHEVESKELQIRNLHQQTQLQQQQMDRRNEQVVYMAIGLVLAAIWLVMLALGIAYRKRKNKLLRDQRDQIRQQASILQDNNRELHNMNEELATAMEELRQSNDNLSYLNNHLEQLVDDRTAVLKLQNEKLAQHAFTVAHVLRAPLARILGLTYLFLRTTQLPAHDRDMLTMLDDAAKELDTVTREMQNTLAQIEEHVTPVEESGTSAL